MDFSESVGELFSPSLRHTAIVSHPEILVFSSLWMYEETIKKHFFPLKSLNQFDYEISITTFFNFVRTVFRTLWSDCPLVEFPLTLTCGFVSVETVVWFGLWVSSSKLYVFREEHKTQTSAMANSESLTPAGRACLGKWSTCLVQTERPRSQGPWDSRPDVRAPRPQTWCVTVSLTTVWWHARGQCGDTFVTCSGRS